MKKITKGKMWQFAIGQLGWSILSGLIVNWLVYFYQPNKEAIDAGQILFIPQGTVIFGTLTIIGIVAAAGRIFDAITDPLIASCSDRCKSKNGRRIPFMRYISLPFAIITVLIFMAPFNKVNAFNCIWLIVTDLLFYICMTCYCTPYNALCAELGKTQEDRLNISTFISVTYMIGTGIAYMAPTIWGILEPSLGRITAMRMTFAGMAVIALICMLIPTFTIKEKDYIDSKPSETNAFESLRKTLKNKNFRVFVASDIAYWIGLTIFQTGLPFYITSLLKLPESMATVFFLLMSGLSFIFYMPVNLLTKKVGKKIMVLIAFSIFAIAYVFTGLTGDILGFSSMLQGIMMAVLVSFPMAILGILPQAMVADIAEAEAIESGENREAMFYATRTFGFKMGQSVAMLLFTALAAIGGTSSVFGYRLTAFVAAVFCLLGGIILINYNEKRLNETLSNELDS